MDETLIQLAKQDPDVFVQALRIACQQRPEIMGEALGQFATMGEIRRVVRENARKIGGWAADDAGLHRTAMVCKQFMIHSSAQCRSLSSELIAAGTDSVDEVVRLVEVVLDAGGGTEEVRRELHRVAKIARNHVRIDADAAVQQFTDAVVTQAHNVGDTCLSELEAILLRAENAALRGC